MRKYLLLALALTTSLSATAPTTTDEKPSTTLTGFYAGILAGGTHYNTEGEVEFAGFSIKSNKQSSQQPSYGLMIGYGKILSNAYLGAEVGVHIDKPSKSTYQYTIGKATISSEAKYKRSPIFSIAPRLGFAFTDSSMIYVKPALEVSSDQILEDGDKSSRKIQYVFAPSVGLERAFSHSLVRLEYGYNFGTKLKIKHTETVSTIEGSQSLKYTSHAIKLGLAYKF